MIEKMIKEIDCDIPRVYQAIFEQLQFMRQEPRGHFEIRQIAVRIAISHKRPTQKDFDELFRAMHALLWEHDHLLALTDGLWIPGLEVMPVAIRKKRIPVNEPYYRRLCQHAWERHIPALLQNPFGEDWHLPSTHSLSEDRQSVSLRFAVLKRDSYRCRLCGISAKDGPDVRLEVDHITPRSKGGTNDPSNLWVLCFPCNRGKGAQDL